MKNVSVKNIKLNIRIAAVYVLLSAMIALLHSCMIEDAPMDNSRSLSVVADYFTGSDSMLLKRFARIQKVKVKWTKLHTKRLIERIEKEPFNVGVDVILTHDRSFRIHLMRNNWLKGVDRPKWMDQMENQFKKKFWYWLPLSHDPLLVTAPADTSGLCFPINFRVWHKDKDTIPPMVRLTQHQKEYQEQLEKSNYLNWLNLVKPRGYWSSERLYTLTGIVEKLTHKDSTFNKNLHSCKTYVKNEKDHYITRTYCAGIYRNGENQHEAQQFVRFYSNYMYRVAAERNELPVRTDIPVGKLVRRAEIR